MLRHKFGIYWNQTETYEALKIYIQMDMDGLQDAVVRMLAGEAIKINTGTFSNDMATFASKDDVLTLLVHLGYLTYNKQRQIKMPDRIAHGDSSLLKSSLSFIIRHSKADGKSHRHLVQN